MNYYNDEINTLILIALLKKHGIKKVIASPGTTNANFVVSLQHDDWFEMYSAFDERSAAYMACGLSNETGQPVVLSCTGATASRNYVPGLTEAYYRKLPILVVTSTQHSGRIGQNIPQVIDRSVQMKDIVKVSVQIPLCHTQEDEWACNTHINRAILALSHNGGGPSHINLETAYNNSFATKQLPEERPIFRVDNINSCPQLPSGKIGIYVGAHKVWTTELTNAVDYFCEIHNAVVLCDQTSNYRGKYRVLFSLVSSQDYYKSDACKIDLLIHIGEVSGAYPSFDVKTVWRVSPDGEVKDSFYKLRYVFEMEEVDFFNIYNQNNKEITNNTYLEQWKLEESKVRNRLPDIPFSNIWISQMMSSNLPNNSILHLGILNSLRAWNFFETPASVHGSCNTGGFGIDGIMSTAVGASLGCRDKLVFCIIGDLAFFYDINSLTNRHVGNNLRILLINNGLGVEFRNYNHRAAQLGDDADLYVSAANHAWTKSPDLVKHYACDLGFEYFSASNKNEFMEQMASFVDIEAKERSIIFEVFTNWKEESEALKLMRNIIVDDAMISKEKFKKSVKNLLGEDNTNKLKRLVNRN